MTTLFQMERRVAELNDFDCYQAAAAEWRSLGEAEKVARAAKFKTGQKVRDRRGDILVVGPKSETLPEMVGCLRKGGTMAIFRPFEIEAA